MYQHAFTGSIYCFSIWFVVSSILILCYFKSQTEKQTVDTKKWLNRDFICWIRCDVWTEIVRIMLSVYNTNLYSIMSVLNIERYINYASIKSIMILEIKRRLSIHNENALQTWDQLVAYPWSLKKKATPDHIRQMRFHLHVFETSPQEWLFPLIGAIREAEFRNESSTNGSSMR